MTPLKISSNLSVTSIETMTTSFELTGVWYWHWHFIEHFSVPNKSQQTSSNFCMLYSLRLSAKELTFIERGRTQIHRFRFNSSPICLWYVCPTKKIIISISFLCRILNEMENQTKWKIFIDFYIFKKICVFV